MALESGSWLVIVVAQARKRMENEVKKQGMSESTARFACSVWNNGHEPCMHALVGQATGATWSCSLECFLNSCCTHTSYSDVLPKVAVEPRAQRTEWYQLGLGEGSVISDVTSPRQSFSQDVEQPNHHFCSVFALSAGSSTLRWACA